jgi:hypothetical protein
VLLTNSHRQVFLGKNQNQELAPGSGFEETDVSVMPARAQLRTIRRNALARWSAVLIIALVVCPFTAPFASYDSNATPIGSLLSQDGSLLDISCDKAPLVASLFFTLPVSLAVATLAAMIDRGTTFDPFLLQSMVLRV